jgi:hypothetical protein
MRIRSWNSQDCPSTLSHTIMQMCTSSSSASDCEIPTTEVNLSTNKRVHWTTEDETKLIDFLLSKANGNTASNGMFKDTVFNEVAEELEGSCIKGAKKSRSSCKTKWSRVCTSLYVFYLYPGLYD